MQLLVFVVLKTLRMAGLGDLSQLLVRDISSSRNEQPACRVRLASGTLKANLADCGQYRGSRATHAYVHIYTSFVLGSSRKTGAKPRGLARAR